jgi:hypothetical protein
MLPQAYVSNSGLKAVSSESTDSHPPRETDPEERGQNEERSVMRSQQHRRRVSLLCK